MLRYAVAAVLVVAAGLTAGAADDDDDDKYTSKKGKFAIAFPSDAKVKTSSQDAGAGIKMHSFTVETGAKAYIVMYMDLPEAVKDVPPKTLLDGGEKGAVKNSGGELLKTKDFKFGDDKLPSREILLEKDGNKVRAWIIINELRVYVILVGGPKDYATGKAGTAFLGSFEIK